ncbi:MAG: protein translocase subunit SecF [Actinobacteria bacterium]|nr:protein translocase subunit SecF [Actinomycetota bacterium]
MTDMSTMGPSTHDAQGGGGIFSRLYRGETRFDFVGRLRLWFLLSGLIILAGMMSLGWRGLNLGIEFEGGSSWEVPGKVSVSSARDELRKVGLPDAQVQTLRGSGGDRLRVQAETATKVDARVVTETLAKLSGKPVSQVSFMEVGPSWGNEVTNKAARALVIFLLVITLYIAWRFEWKMAIATLAALFHDILITVGVYSLAGFPVTPATVIAVLTILGYSIYDGIVVFDKVDENAKNLLVGGRVTYSAMVNNSLNEVLMRTLNTSITALLPIMSLLVIGSFVLGATTLQEFALALLIGLGSGAYSSIFIASPLLAVLKEREPRNVAIREKIGSKVGGPSDKAGPSSQGKAAGAAAAAVGPEEDEATEDRAVVTKGSARRVGTGGVEARARKKGKRK